MRPHRLTLALCLLVIPSTSLAAWKVETGRKIYASFPPPTGTLAKVSAKAPASGVTAYLQLECFNSQDLGGISLFIVLSKNPANGFIAWRYQFDEKPAVQTRPYSRALPPEAIHLGDASSEEVKGLRTAKLLKLTLLPADGSQLPFEFDVSGGADAIKAIGCKEYKR